MTIRPILPFLAALIFCSFLVAPIAFAVGIAEKSPYANKNASFVFYHAVTNLPR